MSWFDSSVSFSGSWIGREPNDGRKSQAVTWRLQNPRISLLRTLCHAVSSWLFVYFPLSFAIGSKFYISVCQRMNHVLSVRGEASVFLRSRVIASLFGDFHDRDPLRHPSLRQDPDRCRCPGKAGYCP